MARLYISRGEGRQGIRFFVENAMTKFPAAIKPFLLYSIKKKNSALLTYPLSFFLTFSLVKTPPLVIFALCSVSTWQKNSFLPLILVLITMKLPNSLIKCSIFPPCY